MPPNPNLPPAAANVAHSPVELAGVPGANQEWTDEIADRSQLDSILTEARKIERDEIALAEFLRKRDKQHDLSLTHTNPHARDFHAAQAARLDAAATTAVGEQALRRSRNAAQIQLLGSRSNPSALLAAIELETGNAHEYTASALKKADTAADEHREHKDRHTKAELLFRSASRHGSDTATINALRRQASLDWEKRQRAAGKEETTARSHLERGSYTGALYGLAHELRRDYERFWNEAEQLNQDITVSLRHWGMLEGRAYPTQERDVRDMLQDYEDVIDHLPAQDSARAEALANYTRLRYRLEQRCINDDITNGTHNPARAFTENRGIIMHGATQDVIIYEDGTTAREDASGVWTRRTASGEIVDPTRTTVLEIDPDVPVQPLDSAFDRWEEHRTPETAAAAHASLGEFIQEQTIVEEQHMGTIDQLTHEITEVDDIIANVPTEITHEEHHLHILRSSIADPANITPKEQQAITTQENVVNRLRDQLAQARRDRPALVAQRAAEARNLRAVRTNLNPAVYWHGLLEVNTERRVLEANRGARLLGRFIGRRETQRMADALPAEPILLSDGRLVLDIATINGIEVVAGERHMDPEWHLWSDGSASIFDRGALRPTQFKPDGTRI